MKQNENENKNKKIQIENKEKLAHAEREVYEYMYKSYAHQRGRYAPCHKQDLCVHYISSIQYGATM